MVTKRRGKLPQHIKDGLDKGTAKNAERARARQKAAIADEKLLESMNLAEACSRAYTELYNGRRQKPRAFELLQGKALLATVNLLDHVLRDHKGIYDYIRTLTAPQRIKPEIRVEIKGPEIIDPNLKLSAFDIADHLPEQFRR